MTQYISNGTKPLPTRRFPRLSICSDNLLHNDCSRNCICIRCLFLFITRYGNLCERWSCRETRPPCFHQFNSRAALSPQRRFVICAKRRQLRGVGASARRAHPALQPSAAFPSGQQLKDAGLSRPGALRAFAPLRAGSWGNGTCSETALPFLADPCPTRQPFARSRTPLAIRTPKLSPRALPTRQRVRQRLHRRQLWGNALVRAPQLLLPRRCPARLPCGGSRGLPTPPPLGAQARGHRRRGTCCRFAPHGRSSAARSPSRAPASFAVLVEIGCLVSVRCRGAAALRWLLVVPRRGMFPARMRLPHSYSVGGSPPPRAPAGQRGRAPARALLVCTPRPVPLPPRGGPAPRCVRGRRGPPPRLFGRFGGARRAGGGQGAPAACAPRAPLAPFPASAAPVPPRSPSPSRGVGSRAPPSVACAPCPGACGGLWWPLFILLPRGACAPRLGATRAHSYLGLAR